MVGLTSLHFRYPPVLPKLNRRRAQFVLTKIDEILAWEQKKDAERDTKFERMDHAHPIPHPQEIVRQIRL